MIEIGRIYIDECDNTYEVLEIINKRAIVIVHNAILDKRYEDNFPMEWLEECEELPLTSG